MFLPAQDIDDDLLTFGTTLIPMVTKENYPACSKFLPRVGMVEIAYEPGIENVVASLKALNENLCISVGLPLRADMDYAGICVDLAATDLDTLHVYADSSGRETAAAHPRFIKDMLRDIHLGLVDASLRQQINILASGGISMAEHVNKAIICGADGVVIDRPLLIAMECRLCGRCTRNLPCPVSFETMDPEYGSTRIINLMGAWHNQMLELLGAMGLREARRLRGEVGRSMWFEDLERDSFAPIFGERKVSIDIG
jgi:glutamate synthase domain-containing protein 2